MVEKLEYSSKKNATKLMMFVEGMDYSVLKLNGQVPHKKRLFGSQTWI